MTRVSMKPFKDVLLSMSTLDGNKLDVEQLIVKLTFLLDLNESKSAAALLVELALDLFS